MKSRNLNKCNNNIKEINELKSGKNEIQRKLKEKGRTVNNYEKYGLLDYNWFVKYEKVIYNPSLYESNKKDLFNIKDLMPKNDEKDYSFIKSSYIFGFPSNFIIVRKQLMELLSNNFKNNDKKNRVKNYLFEMTIRNQCIIMKNKNGKGPFRYIIYMMKRK